MPAVAVQDPGYQGTILGERRVSYVYQAGVATIVAELSRGITLLFPQDRIEVILFGSYARGDAAVRQAGSAE